MLNWGYANSFGPPSLVRTIVAFHSTHYLGSGSANVEGVTLTKMVMREVNIEQFHCVTCGFRRPTLAIMAIDPQGVFRH